MFTLVVAVIYVVALLTTLMLFYGTPIGLRNALAYCPEKITERLSMQERIALAVLAIPLTIYYAVGPYGSGWDFLTVEAPVLIFKGRRVWPSDFN